MTTCIRIVRSPSGRVRAELRAGELTPRLLDCGDAHVRVALVATVALLLAGDDVVIDVEVGPGLHLELVETSGTVAYDMRGGRASWRVEARVADDATLVWTGLPFVVSAGATVTRRASLTLADNARAVLHETLVLGRTGEVGGDLWTSTDVRRPDGRPVLREDLDLSRPHRQDAAMIGSARCLDQVTLLGFRAELEGPDVLQLAEPGTIVRSLTDHLHESSLPALSGTVQGQVRSVTRWGGQPWLPCPASSPTSPR
ncbi:MAG: urease accessory protein UreD [Nocardioides sp.]